jgi:prepilin-type N-terminal cleavage/methylation domain-containing protein
MAMHKKAFTLIELLVVIAVIAVLMAILMPSLHRAREQGKRIVCQGNLKQMSLGWIMYAQENGGKIMSGNPGTGQDACWGHAGKEHRKDHRGARGGPHERSPTAVLQKPQASQVSDGTTG